MVRVFSGGPDLTVGDAALELWLVLSASHGLPSYSDGARMAGVGNPAGTVQEKAMAPPEVAELRNAVNPMRLHALVVADSAAKAIGRYEAYGEAGLQGPQQGAARLRFIEPAVPWPSSSTAEAIPAQVGTGEATQAEARREHGFG